jgi:hypothetical protein
MSESENDFGKEIVELSRQFLGLAELAARNGGFRDQARARELLKEINALCNDTRALISERSTQEQVDAVAARYRDTMSHVFDAIKIPGVSPQ